LDLALAVHQVEAAGLTVVGSGSADSVMRFFDVGALAWYLKAVPWEVPRFSAVEHRCQLAKLHEQTRTQGPLEVRLSYMWLDAGKSRVVIELPAGTAAATRTEVGGVVELIDAEGPGA
jgi:hypothetical protein